LHIADLGEAVDEGERFRAIEVEDLDQIGGGHR